MLVIAKLANGAMRAAYTGELHIYNCIHNVYRLVKLARDHVYQFDSSQTLIEMDFTSAC
jgi:hypothetical protein